MTKPLLAILLLASCGAVAAPQDPFNKPVSISWWHSSCKGAYITNPERGYSKGYCDGVMLAYMNELEQWCVPDDVSWAEVQDYVGSAIAEATIKPLSQIDIGNWISNALVVKWPCEVANTFGLVTDPELIEKLNAKRDAQNTELTQEEPESQQQIPVQAPPGKLEPATTGGEASKMTLGDAITEAFLQRRMTIIGKSRDAVAIALRREWNWDGGYAYRLGRRGIKELSSGECEDRGAAQWCNYGPFQIVYLDDAAIALVITRAEEGMRDLMKAQTHELSKEIQPIESTEDRMIWEDENIILSLNWLDGTFMWFDAVKLAEAQD